MTNPFSFNETQFNRLFPFYILINRDLKVISLGKSISKLYDWDKDKKFKTLFSIPRPMTPIDSFDDLIVLQNQLVVLESATPQKLLFRGQFEYLSETDQVLFAGSPWFGSMEQVRENNLVIDDFAKHDPLIDLLHVMKSQDITNEDLKQLVSTINKQKNDLKKANKEVHDIALFTNQNPDPLIRLNFEGHLLQNNPAAARLDFIEFENTVYRNDDFFKLISERIDTNEKMWEFEASSENKDFSFVCVTMEDEGYINIYGRDITRKKKYKLELEKLSLIVQQTINAVIITDAKGKVEWVNNAFERVTGYNLSETKGKTPGSFLQGKETDMETVAYMKQQILKSEPFSCEIFNYKKSGEGYWLRINGQPIFDKQGKVINFFAIEEDITGEKEAQEKLRKAASRMSSLITNLQDAILLENNNQSIELVNDRFCELFKIPVSPKQLIGADCSKAAEQSKNLFANPEAFVSGIDEILKNKRLVIGDQLALANGKILERNFIPIWNDGNYEGHLWVYSDITEKITANKKIEDLRAFYEKVLDNIPSDIAVFDKEHHYLYVNSIGIKDPELRKWIIGKKDEDYIKKRNKPLYLLESRRKIFNEVIESKQLKSWEEELKQEDGSSKFILRNLYPVVNKSKEVELVIGYGIDITNIKTVQQRIEQSEQRYKDLIENSLAIITTHDLQGRFLTVNPMVEKLYGYQDDDVIGRFLTDFMPDEDKLLFNENYLKIIKNNKEATGIFRVLHKDGHIVYSLYNNYLKEEPGKKPYVIGFAVDISDRVLAEKELKIAKKVTEELAQTKQNFLANMSHEIRTPMNAIIGMSRQLQKTVLNEKQHVYLDTITNASENLLVIINDILDLSKMESGKLSFEKIGFEPRQVIERVLQVMTHKAEEKGLNLTNSYCDQRLFSVLLGDPYRINQILLNLVSNAIKFTAFGGVDISCNVLEENDKIQQVEISITDTGIGMESSFLKNLFQKFNQEDESIARRFGGTGLGMSITKSLVDAMGGEIFVESEKNKGTIIKLRFSFEKGLELDLPKKENTYINTNNLKDKKILIVDDNEINRMVATTILEEYGVLVTEAENGSEAINHIKNEAYDLVLMDIQMPVLNGYEATKIIREELKSNIPIIALTANAIKGENEKCIDMGMNDYLSKPFEEEQLLQIVSHWLDRVEDPVIAAAENKKQPPLYNLSKLEKIAKGNQQFIDKMIQLFIDQTPKSVNELKTAYEIGDYSKVKEIAHRIKPSLDTIGVDILKEDIRVIEKNADSLQSSEQIEKLISKLDAVINEIVDSLKKLIKQDY